MSEKAPRPNLPSAGGDSNPKPDKQGIGFHVIRENYDRELKEVLPDTSAPEPEIPGVSKGFGSMWDGFRKSQQENQAPVSQASEYKPAPYKPGAFGSSTYEAPVEAATPVEVSPQSVAQELPTQKPVEAAPTAQKVPEVPAKSVELEQKTRLRWHTGMEPQPETKEAKTEVEERQKWLMAAFSADKDAPGGNAIAAKSGIAGIIQRSHEKRRQAGYQPSEASEKLIAKYALSNVSLRDLFQQANKPEDLQVLKSIGADLLSSYVSSDGQKPWEKCSPQEKKFIRLGELIAFEAERRMLEKKMVQAPLDPGLARKRYEQYFDYSKNPDIPRLFRERLWGTMDQLKERFTPAKSVEKIQPKKSEIRKAPKKVSTAAVEKRPASVPNSEVLKGIDTSLTGRANLEQLSQMNPDKTQELVHEMERVQEVLFGRDPDVRDEFLELRGDGPAATYNPDAIGRLRTEYRVKGDKQAEGDRQRFIDSLWLQMDHAAFKNSNPSLWSRFFRGTVDGMRTRWQVAGWKALVPWPTTIRSVTDRMGRAREEVAKSWLALANNETYPARASAMAHALELSMANANDALRHGPPRFAGKGRPDLSAANEAISSYYNQKIAVEGGLQNVPTLPGTEPDISGKVVGEMKSRERVAGVKAEDTGDKTVFNGVKVWRLNKPNGSLSDLQKSNPKLFSLLVSESQLRGQSIESVWGLVGESIESDNRGAKV